MKHIAGWFRRNNTIMAQAKDLSRQLQEAWDEDDKLSDNLVDSWDYAGDLLVQLHRVARERDNERKLRLEAEDKLLDYHLDKDADPMDGPEFIWVHLNHPCREIDVWYVTQPEEAKIAKRQGYIPLTTLRLIYAAEELRDAYLEELENEEE